MNNPAEILEHNTSKDSRNLEWNIDACPACGSKKSSERATFKGLPVYECGLCELQWQSPQPSDERLAQIYGNYYFLGSDEAENHKQKLEMKRATASLYLDQIGSYLDKSQGAVLEIGCGQGEFLKEAIVRGYSVTGVEYSDVACSTARKVLSEVAGSTDRYRIEQGELENVELNPGFFDVCVMNDVIEHVRDPKRTLLRIRELLKPGGTLFLATPSLDSWSAKLMGRLWMEYKEEHLSYFSNKALMSILGKCGFSDVVIKPGYKILTLDYILQHFEKFSVPGFSALVKAIVSMLPKSLRQRQIRVVASGVVVLATAS